MLMGAEPYINEVTHNFRVFGPPPPLSAIGAIYRNKYTQPPLLHQFWITFLSPSSAFMDGPFIQELNAQLVRNQIPAGRGR